MNLLSALFKSFFITLVISVAFSAQASEQSTLTPEQKLDYCIKQKHDFVWRSFEPAATILENLSSALDSFYNNNIPAVNMSELPHFEAKTFFNETITALKDKHNDITSKDIQQLDKIIEKAQPQKDDQSELANFRRNTIVSQLKNARSYLYRELWWSRFESGVKTFLFLISVACVGYTIYANQQLTNLNIAQTRDSLSIIKILAQELDERQTQLNALNATMFALHNTTLRAMPLNVTA